MAKSSNELPHILSKADPEHREATERAFLDEHDNDELCVRLGRAFLKGRLDALMGIQREDWPCDSADECNLYAGGYQYDDQPSGPMEELHELMQTLPEGEAKDKLVLGKEIMEGLAALERQEQEHGLTLELLSQRCDLRFKLQSLTIDNLGHAQALMQMQQKMESPLMEMLSRARRPMATDKPDASDHG
jgi:hypothetical protein